MAERIRNVLVEFGTALRFDDKYLAGTGLVLSAPDADNAHTVTKTSVSGTPTSILSKNVCADAFAARFYIMAAGGLMRVGARTEGSRLTTNAAREVNFKRADYRQFGSAQGEIAYQSDGKIYVDGSLMYAGLATYTAGDVIDLAYLASYGYLLFLKNGTIVNSVAATGVFRFGVSITNTSGAIKMTGEAGFTWQPENYRPAGVWARFALNAFTTSNTDTLRNTYFDARILSDSEPSFTLAPSIPALSDTLSRSSGDFGLNNADNALDVWLDWETINQAVTVKVGYLGDPYSAHTTVSTGTIEDIRQPAGDESRLRVTPRDISKQLEIPWQTELYSASHAIVALQNTAKPTCLGSTLAVPLVMTDSANLEYDFSDTPAYNISAVYDRGVLLTRGTGYSVNTTNSGITRLTNPDGKQVVDVYGTLIDNVVYVDAYLGNFNNWTGSPAVPVGWSNSFTGGTSTVTAVGSDGARFLSNGSGGTFASLHAASIFPIGAATMRVDVECTAYVKGSLNIRLTNFGAAYIDKNIAAVGSYSFYITKPALANGIQVLTNFVDTDITIARLRITRVEDGGRLYFFLKHALTQRGPLPLSALNYTELDAFYAVRQWPLCLNTGQGNGTRVIDVIDMVARSMGAGWYIAPNGEFKLFALGLTTSVATLTDMELIGDIDRDIEPAGPLSTRVSGVPIWSQHEEADIAGSLYTTSGGRVLAEKLKSRYAFTALGASAGRLPTAYAHALNAKPIETILADTTGTQGLADTQTAFFSVTRWRYRCTAAQDDGLAFVPGQTITVQTNKWDLAAGKPLQIVSVKGVYSDNIVQLELLG